MTRIYEGYEQFSVTYHNDLHGFDVAQMTYFMLHGEDGWKVALQLSPLDTLVTIFSAYCHDFKHDGFTNGYHSNI